MEGYFVKNKNFKVKEDVITFQILDWWAKDEQEYVDSDSESDENSPLLYSIYCFGKTQENQTVTCKIENYHPFYYIKLPTKSSFGYLMKHLKNYFWKKESIVENDCELVVKKDIYGFRNDKYYYFAKLVFINLTDLNRSKYMFKNPVQINGISTKPIKYKLYESSFEPFLKFCHTSLIQTANWISIKNFKQTNTLKNTNIYITTDFKKSKIKKIENTTIANFLQASWDIEVYSFDGEFPDPLKKLPGSNPPEYPNVIYQMATTFKYFNENKIIKYLLTLKKCNDIQPTNENETIIVEYIADESNLIKRWIDIIKNMDPDIIYTYNGDSFDWNYLKARCDLFKITDYLYKHTSRLSSFDSIMKKEFFSSSAYGDNEFNRIYIPGRLNYDLLVHYKRGIKKYASYKLDNIAYEILKEKKNDVSVKQIFEYYKNGKPEELTVIGSYCIQDTHLLQKLVDNQLILITIIQLANVTYVPISYLLSKGQTIKVTSQLIRKANQMNFLVPNTNFNQDTYPIQINFKEPIPDDFFIEGDFLVLEQIGINKPPLDIKTSTKGSNFLNCKISEIVNDQTIIVFANTEIKQIFFNVKLTYRNIKMIVSKVFSINDTIDEGFSGACVLDAQIGYKENNVAVLDFASLYPTIIISRNLCYSTIVLDSSFDNISDINYETIAWDDRIEYKLNHKCEILMKSGARKNQVCGKQAYFEVDEKYSCRTHDPIKKERPENEKYQKKDVQFSYKIVQPDESCKYKGVLPTLLEELYAERKKVKKQMAIALESGNKLYADILDKSQLGIKVSLNSVYGFLGRRQGNMVLKDLGSIVTAVGRKLIEQTKNFAENDFMELIKKEHTLFHQIRVKELDLSKQEKDFLLKKYSSKN